LFVLAGHKRFNSIQDLTFSPNGRILATASQDGTAKLWNTGTGKEIATLSGRLIGMNSAAFSPDDRRLATGSDSGVIKLWDAETYQEILALKGHRGFVHQCFFVDENTLISRSGEEVFSRQAATLAEIEAAENNETKSR
jgi:WD40 repeat protein